MKSFLEISKQLKEAKATYTIKDSEGNIKHAGTDKDIAYKTHKSLNAKEAGHKLYKNGVATLSEVLTKDADAGDWISDFIKSDNPKFAGKSKEKRKEMALAAYYAAQKNEAVMQPNGTDKIIPDEGMCEGLCQVCGEVDCKEHFYKSPAVTGYVKEATVDTADIEKNKLMSNKDKNTLSKLAALMAKQKKSIKEESGEHHDYAHVKKTMKKVDYDAYVKHMNKNDADHSMENKHKVDTQHSGSYTGKIHGAEVSHKVSGSGQKEYYIKEETLDEISTQLALKVHSARFKKWDKTKSPEDAAKMKKAHNHVMVRDKKDTAKLPKMTGADYEAQRQYNKERGYSNESYEAIDEISKETLGNYVNKSFAHGNELHKQIDAESDADKKAKLKAKLSQRNSGVIKAAQKMRNESQDKKPYIVISHVSDNTGTRADGEKVEKNRVATKLIATSPEHALQLSKAHHTKAGRKVHSASIKEEVDMGQADRTLRSKEKSGSKYHVKDSSGKIISTHDNHSDAMRGALKHDDHKVVKEAVDHQHRIARDTVKNPNKSLLGGPSAKEAEETLRKKYGYDDKKIAKLKEAVSTVKKDASGKVIAWSHEGDWQKNSTKNKQGQGKAANLAGRAMQQTRKLTKEEKDDREYGYEGEMVMTQLKTLCRHAEHLMGMLEPDTDLPEWVQSKITLATDYMQTTHDYLMSEMNESLDEGLFDNMPNTKAGFAYKDKKRSERQAEHEKQDPKMAVYYAKNMVDTAKAAKKAKERGITKHADDFGWQVRNGVQRGKLPEEVDLDEAWEVYDTKTRAIHSSHPTQRKALNAMNKLNDKHPGYETPGNLIASKFGARVSGLKEESIDESAWGKDKATNLRQAHDRHMEKALAANKAGDDEAVKTHQRKMQMIQGKMQKLKQNEEVELGEECEILSELSKTALGNYAKAAAFDIANKGSAIGKAGNNLAVLANPKGPLTQLNKRLQGHAKAVQKLTKEEVEEFMQSEAYDQLDELDKKTLGNYVKKAHDQLMKHTSSVNFKGGRGDSDAFAYAHDPVAVRKTANRTKGVDQAINKLTKEDTMVTYKEFMASIEEGRIDDLKDKLAADREKRLNKMDFSKEKEATKNPITKVKGHSYGAGDEDGEAEPVKAAEPAEKRGRGRPAGSKSGARA